MMEVSKPRWMQGAKFQMGMVGYIDWRLKVQEKELELESDEAETEIEVPLPLTVTSWVLYMLGDIITGPAFRFTQWLQLVCKRTAKYRSSGFPHRHSATMPSTSSIKESIEDLKWDLHPDQTEISLWERLGKASMLDIESSSFSWDMLSSLHHTKHNISNEHSEDEMNKALEEAVDMNALLRPVQEETKNFISSLDGTSFLRKTNRRLEMFLSFGFLMIHMCSMHWWGRGFLVGNGYLKVREVCSQERLEV